MLIQKMRVAKAGPIQQSVDFDFNPDVNVLIGPNGCGKSTVIQLLLEAIGHPDESNAHLAVPHSNSDFMHTEDWSVMLTPGSPYVMGQVSLEHFPGFAVNRRVPVVFVPSVRLPFPTTDRVVSDYVLVGSFSQDRNVLDGRYVYRVFEAYHNLVADQARESGGYVTSENDNVAPTVASLIASGMWPEVGDVSSASVDGVDVEDVLRRTWDASDFTRRKQSVMMTACRCAFEICSDVIADPFLGAHTYRVPDDARQRGVSEVTFENWRVNTVDVTNDTLTIGDLSSGTQGALMWLLNIAMQVNLWFIDFTAASKAARFRLRSQAELSDFKDEIRRRSGWNPLSDDLEPKLWDVALDYGQPADEVSHDAWRGLPFVLLIDEIENHLHPTWQRRVIHVLQKYFPNVQIVATTHSPFIVAGLKAGQVHLLNRDNNGVVTATTNSEDIVGWTADEILRTMMGVQDPTDEATAAAARELRQLRSEGPRDTEDAEAARQTRMQELRRLVNRDLLAGGPRAAQRELFEQQFAEALEKYQQSRDLGQENG